MRSLPLSTLIPGVLAVVAGAALIGWLNVGPHDPLHERMPGQDLPPGTAAAAPAVPLKTTLTVSGLKPVDMPGIWPCFRGERLDGIGQPDAPLARQWPPQGPPVLWTAEMGEGYAGPAIRAGRVYVLDYDRQASADALRCLSLADGREIWRSTYPVPVKRNHGMSRTVPFVTDNYVVALGPKCHVTCVDTLTGKTYWMLDLVRRFDATVPPWYAGQCPLVENDRAILAPGGPQTLLIAVQCASGDILWKSPNPRGWRMTHVSIVPMELAGRRMYVYCGSGGVAGIAADDGSLLWDTTDWKISIATVPSPVVLPDGKIFFSGGYNAGALMLQVRRQGDRFVAETLFRLKPDKFGSTQQTPIFYRDHLFGVRERDKQLVCLDLQGNVVWASGRQHRFGLGPYLIADGLIYVLDDEGVLTIAEATIDGYHQLAQHQVLDGPDAWGPMALVGGRLLVRDFTRMACLNVAQ